MNTIKNSLETIRDQLATTLDECKSTLAEMKTKTQNIKLNGWFNNNEAAKVLGIHSGVIKATIALGLIEETKLGAKSVWSKEDLLKLREAVNQYYRTPTGKKAIRADEMPATITRRLDREDGYLSIDSASKEFHVCKCSWRNNITAGYIPGPTHLRRHPYPMYTVAEAEQIANLLRAVKPRPGETSLSKAADELHSTLGTIKPIVEELNLGTVREVPNGTRRFLNKEDILVLGEALQRKKNPVPSCDETGSNTNTAAK